MKYYQDLETGLIHAFEDDVDPRTLDNTPPFLSADIKQKPDDSYVWYQGDWVKQEELPFEYKSPVSSVPSYNPAWMGYLLPYTAVYRSETSGLGISLDQVNANFYDGDKLAEVVATLPLDTPSGLDALISYDGAIAIPQCKNFPNNAEGILELNKIFCSLLLGGIHTEVLHPERLDIGSLQEKKLFAYKPSIHNALRLKWAALPERLAPLMFPRVLMVKDIQDAYRQGQQVIKAIANFSPFFLLNGYSAMVSRNNSDALNNLWIAVEQITTRIWGDLYLKRFKNRDLPSHVMERHSCLKSKNKIKNIDAKQELLELSKVISNECHDALSQARKKRNNLVHQGAAPDLQVIEMLWRVLPELIETASGIGPLGMRKLGSVGKSDSEIPEKVNFDDWMTLKYS